MTSAVRGGKTFHDFFRYEIMLLACNGDSDHYKKAATKANAAAKRKSNKLDVRSLIISQLSNRVSVTYSNQNYHSKNKQEYFL